MPAAKKAKQTDWLIAVGQRFRAIRKKARKPQRGLGVSPTTVGALEKGFGAGPDSIETACRAMDVDPRDVFMTFPDTRGGHAALPREVVTVLHDEAKQRLVLFMGSIGPEDWKAFERHVRAFQADAETSKPRGRLHRG